ncbi:molybdenum cofactor biosynthesis protein MoaE [Acinetobacter cumulans]|uniref:Molybdopterin synthase catalytic subunit n=1 Tax=Acinetobacter cumulans TaxID=2136182 RepID=A0A3A8G6R4_9GAMM|nr:molybdenum cofactor biosynthesis protein MoaE [Acinetobacter cumulans]RKG54358.1 molybdenum cofactor biosynthesis protein MoaE [Acinetobacter cumulans]
MLKDFSRIQSELFSQALFDTIHAFPECGGVGVFIGTVRNHHEGKAVKALKYTAYAPVAEKMIRQIEHDIQTKYGVSYVRVVHRVGALDIGDTAIIAMAYAAHRREAFQACEEAVERVKHEVPVWKEEFYMDGSSQYVEGCCIRKDHDPNAHTGSLIAATHTHCSHQHDEHHLSQDIDEPAKVPVFYQWPL